MGMVDYTAPAPFLPETTSKPAPNRPPWYSRLRLAALWQDVISRKKN
jgi:hypothetical protein